MCTPSYTCKVYMQCPSKMDTSGTQDIVLLEQCLGGIH